MSQLRRGCSFAPEQFKLSRLASNSFIEPYGEAGALLMGDGGWQYFKQFICYKSAFLGANLNRYPGRGRYLNDLELWHFSQALPKLPLCASSLAWQP